MTMALSHQHRKGQHGSYFFVVFECVLQLPHLFVFLFRVQAAAIRGGNDDGQRICTAVPVDIRESLSGLFILLEVVEKAWIGVQSLQTKTQTCAGQHDSYCDQAELSFPETRSNSLSHRLGFL